MVGRRLYFVFCLSLEIEEDEEKTHETTGIGVIEVVPLFYTLLVHYVCTMHKSVILGGFMHFLSRDDAQPTQSQLIQIYSVGWTDVYDTHNIEHRTEPTSH